MDLATLQEKKLTAAVNKIEFTVLYIPGVTQDEDIYQASHEKLGVSSYGSTREEALENAKLQAKAELMDKFHIVDELLKN